MFSFFLRESQRQPNIFSYGDVLQTLCSDQTRQNRKYLRNHICKYISRTNAMRAYVIFFSLERNMMDLEDILFRYSVICDVNQRFQWLNNLFHITSETNTWIKLKYYLFFFILQITTHAKLLSETDKQVIERKLPFLSGKVSLLSLQAFDTEHQFSNRIRLYVLANIIQCEAFVIIS